MSFDVKKQNERADGAVVHYFMTAPMHQVRMPLSPAQRELMRDLARHVYALGFQEGWEASRMNS